MKSFKSFKHLITEEFDEKKAVKDALIWLKKKYDNLYTFKHIPELDMVGEKTKTYDITVDGNEYKLNLRRFDSNGDGESDTLSFDVLPPAIEKEEKEDEL